MRGWMLGGLRALPAGGLLAVGLAVSPAAPVAASQASGTWTHAGSMTTPRQGQTATLLATGQVLVVSGGSAGAELYNPATGKWAATGSPAAPAGGYTATRLQTGQVLLAGGERDGTPATVTSSAELYNPATGTWSAAGGMTTARAGHTATLLPTGQVLVAGGEGACVNFSCPILASAELYTPATGTWAQTGSMNVARDLHAATLLPTRQVLVAGGESGSTAGAGSTAELYTPATGTWASAGRLSAPHIGALAGLLPAGQVLVVCGAPPGYPICGAGLYDPAAGTWADDGAASPSAVRDFTAVLLTSGQVLISGGLTGAYPAKVRVQAGATLFDPATKTAADTGSMTIPRAFHTLTVLPNGQVLAAGGETQDNQRVQHHCQRRALHAITVPSPAYGTGGASQGPPAGLRPAAHPTGTSSASSKAPAPGHPTRSVTAGRHCQARHPPDRADHCRGVRASGQLPDQVDLRDAIHSAGTVLIRE